MSALNSVEDVTKTLAGQAYIADRGLSTSVFLALSLGRPLLLEGEPGVGKTEISKALAAAFNVELIRLQCYEGIDANQALYEWDYTAQLLYTRTISADQAAGTKALDDLFGERFLIERPLLNAVKAGNRCVLLIDEVDRSDDEFEAFLLEVLSDFQVTIPELGTIVAETRPLVIVTSNRTRDLHDALKRRCLYHWIDYPVLEREVQIVKVRAPEVSEGLVRKVAAAVQRMRRLDMAKKPGVAETIDWARALDFLGANNLDSKTADETLGSVVKDRDDLDLVRESMSEIVK